MLPNSFKQIEYVIAACTYNSFRLAADVLGFKPSVMSRTIQQLEERIQAYLFLPGSHGISLTGAGEAFPKGARALVECVSSKQLGQLRA